MTRSINRLKIQLAQLDGRHVRLGLAVLTLALFVIGAGAPQGGGGG
jgi:hypothetical protein